MSASRPLRATSVLLILLATVLAGLAVAPAEAANRATPRNFSGFGFDQCVTQSQEVMDTWLTTSPYWAVGVYIAGDSRYCGDDKQTNLTPEWVATQLRKGWRLLPITVGPQAACQSRYADHVRISANPDGDFATAKKQARAEARTTVRRAEALGIRPTSTLWYDLEAYDISNRRCRTSALSFLSAWTRSLHNLNYVSGVYSSAASGIKALDDARLKEPGRFTMPDRIWTAEWVDAADYVQPPQGGAPSLLSDYFSDSGWLPNGRMRQYRGGHNETYGGVTVNIDTNYLELGAGTVVGKAPKFCGVRVDFPTYRRLRFDQRDPQVRAAQCLLRMKGLYAKDVTGRYNKATKRAVRAFQTGHGLLANGNLNRATWTVLLADGSSPVLKYGSGGNAVRRLQRSLNAAVGAGLDVTGFYGTETTQAVRVYQGAVELASHGVTADPTWDELLAGRF